MISAVSVMKQQCTRCKWAVVYRFGVYDDEMDCSAKLNELFDMKCESLSIVAWPVTRQTFKERKDEILRGWHSKNGGLAESE